VPDVGRFQVWIPVSGNLLQHTRTRTLLGDSVECLATVSRLNGAYAIIEYCDLLPQSLEGLSSSTVLDRVYPELIRDMDIRLEKVAPAIVGETYDALKLQGPQNMRGLSLDGEFQGRAILVEERIYLVAMSVHEQNWCICVHQVDQVLDSFFIDPAMKIPFDE
jgi:hypothetical protein